MKKTKPKVSIIEDKFGQYLVARALLNEDYEIIPDLKTVDEFNSHKARLERFLTGDNTNEEDQAFVSLFNEIDAFVVDWQLIEGNANNTGISFCKKMMRLQNKLAPVLFLTSNPNGKAHNPISRVRDEDELIHIIEKNSQKPQYWKKINTCSEDNLSEEAVKIASKSKEDGFYKDDMKDKINKMLKENTCYIRPEHIAKI